MAQPAPDVNPTVLSADLDEETLEAYRTGGPVAVDTETMGLNVLRDRLCVVQLCNRDGRATLVQIPRYPPGRDVASRAPRLKALLEAPGILKVFHFARFDVAALRHHLGIEAAPLYCTRTASRIIRTYTERHGLKDLAAELLGVELDKTARHSDWSSASLSPGQVRYAVSDVTLLLRLMDRLEEMLEREQRRDLAHECFRAIPTFARLDLLGYDNVFAHH
jgi:ribonuclease D